MNNSALAFEARVVRVFAKASFETGTQHVKVEVSHAFGHGVSRDSAHLLGDSVFLKLAALQVGFGQPLFDELRLEEDFFGLFKSVLLVDELLLVFSESAGSLKVKRAVGVRSRARRVLCHQGPVISQNSGVSLG